jgi:hypothetical protein
MPLGGAAQRTAGGFFHASLVAVLAMVLLPTVMNAVIGLWPAARGLSAVLTWCYTPVGLAIGGGVAGASIERETRGPIVFGTAFLTAGILLSWPLFTLQGLTGFEPPAVVIPFTVTVFAVAFGSAGALAGQMLRLTGARRVGAALGAAAGGGCGGLVLLVPLLFRAIHASAVLGSLTGLVFMATTSVSVVVPMTVTGYAFGRALDAEATG